MVGCSDCQHENRDGAQFCEACGARIESDIAKSDPGFARMDSGDEGASAPSEDEGAIGSKDSEDELLAGLMGAKEDGTDSIEPEGDAPSDPTDADAPSDWTDTDAPSDATDAEEEVEAGTPKAGYLVFPDNTEQPIPPSQWLIGRADLSKYLADSDKANEISRGHVTVFEDGEKFFIEDGKTMVQEKPSANKTWLVRGGARILVTGTGRNELQDTDEIDIAELVKLQFVIK